MKGALAVGGTVTTGMATLLSPPVEVGSGGGLLVGTEPVGEAGISLVMGGGGGALVVAALVATLVVDLSDVVESTSVLGGLSEELVGPVEEAGVFCDRTVVARIPRTRLVKSGLLTLIFEGSFDIEYVQRQRSDEIGGVERRFGERS